MVTKRYPVATRLPQLCVVPHELNNILQMHQRQDAIMTELKKWLEEKFPFEATSRLFLLLFCSLAVNP